MVVLHNIPTQKEILDVVYHNTLFYQTLSLISGHVFQKLEHRRNTGPSLCVFGFKNQFTAVAFMRLAARRSTRDGLRSLSASKAPKHKPRFKSKLFCLDAAAIRLCLSLFPRAPFRQTKGGIKMHALPDHDSHIPALAAATDAKIRESRIAGALVLPKGSIVAFNSCFGLPVQQLFQLIQGNLLTAASLKKLLNPQSRKKTTTPICYI